MKNKSESIRKIVGYLNEPEHDGGFWLPNIQRPFVWNEEQIEKLFDSLMREYPISTLLVWRTRSPIKRRKFIDNYREDIKLSHYQVPEDDKCKLLVLDGQQRLQGLFIGLKGSYAKKELFLNLLSGDLTTPEDIRFKFKFIDPRKATFPYVNFKKIVFSNDLPNKLVDHITKTTGAQISEENSERMLENIWKTQQVFVNREAVSYQELDSVDNPDAYSENDVVEIFIRANSGGTRLGKSDLLFSLLTSSWEDADEAMEDLITDLNAGGFAFTRDFILKTCLVLLNKGANYDVKKFRDGKTKEQIIEHWAEISNAIKDVCDYLTANTYIRSDHALPSYLGLIPAIYYRYWYPDDLRKIPGLDTYFLRTLLCGAFSGRPDNLIDKCVRKINSEKTFTVPLLFDVIYSDGRNLDVSEDTILGATYGSKIIHLLFNLWYREFNYRPTFSGNVPQVDHIFPQSLLRSIKDENPETGRSSILRYPSLARDQIANCMLLTATENGFSNKCDKPPAEWFSDKSGEYLDTHLIPNDPNLWRVENYEKFIKARKQLILERFNDILSIDQKFGIDDRSAQVMREAIQFDAPELNLNRERKLVNTETPYELVHTSSTVPDGKQETSPLELLKEAEEMLETVFERIANPSKYIAGFRAPNGKELALLRMGGFIKIWSEPVNLEDENPLQPSKVYAPNEPRSSGLNSKNCPNLKIEKPAFSWHFHSISDLEDFVLEYGDS